VLERAGLVRRTRRGRNNTLELAPQPLREVAQWLLKYEQFWNSRLDRLQQFFAQQNQKANKIKGEMKMNFTDITVNRTIPAPADKIYDVWIDPKARADRGTAPNASSSIRW